jgi:hypothetical protein
MKSEDLSQLASILSHQKRKLERGELVGLREAMKVIELKKKHSIPISRVDLIYLLIKEVLTTVDRDEIAEGDML